MSQEYQRKTKSSAKDSKLSPGDSHQMDSGCISDLNLLSSSSMPSEVVSLLDKDVSEDRVTTDSTGEKFEHVSKDSLDSGLGLSSLKLDPDNVVPVHQPCAKPPQTTLEQMGLSSAHIDILKEIFKKDDEGDNQLHIAVMRGFFEVVWHMTRLLPHQAFLDISNESGTTALHMAVNSGNPNLVRHLIVCGASPVTRNEKGDTPLHVACSIGDYNMVSMITGQVTSEEVVQARLAYSPNYIAGLLAADLNNYNGQSCIHVAARGAHKDILQHLTWYGADINAKDCKGGRTALHFAVESRDSELIKFLAETCRAALSISQYAGLTPYQLAVANDVPKLASLLEELGATKETLPYTYAVEDDLDNDDDLINLGADDLSWQETGIQIAGVTFPYSSSTAVPVSFHGPLNADRLL